MVHSPAVSASCAVSLARTSSASVAQRLLFLDNLRVVAMAMVILQHVGQAYGPTGGAWPIQDASRAGVLGPFFTVNRSFGMSLFFMIAGYLMIISADRKGALPFLKDRLLRLGLPLLGFCIVMEFLQAFVFAVPANGYSRGVAWPVEAAHMWFVEHLLIYSTVYAAWRWLRRHHPIVGPTTSRVPPWWAIVAFALALALVSFVVRTWYAIDHWVYLLGFIKVAWADVPRDLSLFVIGAIAYRKGWLGALSPRSGRVWLAVGLLLAVVMYYVRLARPDSALNDGRSIGYAVWESLLCVSMCIGLVVLFRDLWNSQGALGKRMAQGQYATYVFHIGVVLLFQWALLGLVAAPFAKFVLASLLSVPAAFLVGYWVSKPLRL